MSSATLRVNVQALSVKRKDGTTIDDDFKSWATVATANSSGGAQPWWYGSADSEANLSKTSVRVVLPMPHG